MGVYIVTDGGFAIGIGGCLGVYYTVHLMTFGEYPTILPRCCYEGVAIEADCDDARCIPPHKLPDPNPCCIYIRKPIRGPADNGDIELSPND